MCKFMKMEDCNVNNLLIEVKKHRIALSIKDKYEIIQEIQKGKKQSVLCQERKLHKSTVATIWKKRDLLLKAVSNKNVNVKKIRRSAHEEVDQALYQWYSQEKLKNVVIKTSILHAKAEELGRILKGNGEFSCTDSWIERFKRRHNIFSGKNVTNFEFVALNEIETVESWLENKWPIHRENYNDDDIFSADETGLFFRLTPDKTIQYKGEKCANGSSSKERITVLVCVNVSGSEKRKLLVIGNKHKPRSFKSVRSLPVTYSANKNAWMNSEIFLFELCKWDLELQTENRNILLIVDICPAHPDVIHLQNIKLVFLPVNLSSKLNPMDRGIIYTLKIYYRKFLLQKIVDYLDKKENPQISLLDAVNFIHRAWQILPVQTIRNCFRQAGFLVSPRNQMFGAEHVSLSEAITMDTDAEEENPLSEWINTNRFANCDIDEYVRVDDSLITAEVQNNIEISSETKSQCESSDEECEMEPESTTVSVRQACEQMTSIRTFLQSQIVPQSILDNFAQVEMFINELNIVTKANVIDVSQR